MTGPVVVVGGGLAGSLLVQALARTAAGQPVVLVDPLDQPTVGRAWAFFEPDRGTVAGVPATRRFRDVRIAGPGGDRVLHLREHSYTVLDGDVLARRTEAALVGVGSRRRGSVTSVDREHGQVRIDGDAVDARLVCDSVGVERPDRTPAAWLHFTGWRVSSHPAAFDPSAVTLMDFRVPQRGQLRFVYVLPASDHEALVELTVLSGSPDLPTSADEDLTAYLRTVLGLDAWQAGLAEAGRLALDPGRGWHRGLHARTRGHALPVVRIGSAAGLVKASTGYGVRLMERDARALAADVAHGRTPRGLRRRARHRLLDTVFLRLAVSDPARLRDGLERMFAANPVDRVVRFLDEESSLLDEARLIATLPVRPFTRAALRLPRRPPRVAERAVDDVPRSTLG